MLSKKKIELINELEYLIGNSCYNPNSYDGWTMEEGCSFRYPVWHGLGDHETKTRNKVNCKTEKDVKTLHYEFGSNHLYIGEALSNVLNYLENIYDLDFSKLDRKDIEP